MRSDWDAVPRPASVLGCVLVVQRLRVRKTVHDPQVGDLGTLIVRQGGVGGIGVGELGVAASRVYRTRGQKRCLLRVFVDGAVDMPMEITLPIGGQQRIRLGWIQSDGLDFGVLVFACWLHHELPKQSAECQQLFVADVDLAVDHDAVFVEGTLRVRGSLRLDQLIRGHANDLETHGGRNRIDGDRHCLLLHYDTSSRNRSVVRRIDVRLSSPTGKTAAQMSVAPASSSDWSWARTDASSPTTAASAGSAAPPIAKMR